LNDTTNTVYLNGEYLPVDQAKVSVLDRGFLYGDGVYEVVPVFHGRPLRLQQHLKRLDNSLGRISLDNPLSHEQWRHIFDTLLAKNPGDDRAIYLQVSRGAYPKRDLSIKQDYPATVFVMIMPVAKPDIARVARGISAITVEDFRWQACDIKSTSLVANVMLKQQAAAAGVEDAILIRGGHVTEGTASNVFIVKEGVLITPPVGNQLLPGITRDLVIEIALKGNIIVEERDLREAELFSADEIWMTSSTREIAPVIMLDGGQVGDGRPGPVWQQVLALYQQCKDDLKKARIG